jgi:hypothetical protein
MLVCGGGTGVVAAGVSLPARMIDSPEPQALADTSASPTSRTSLVRTMLIP